MKMKTIVIEEKSVIEDSSDVVIGEAFGGVHFIVTTRG